MSAQEHARISLAEREMAPRAGDAEDETHLVRVLLQTTELKHGVRFALPEMLRAWAGESRCRTVVARVLARILVRGFKASGNGRGETSLPALLREPGHAKQVAQRLPGLMNGLLDAIAAVTEGVALLSPEEKRRVVHAALDQLDPARAGKLLTDLMRIFNDAEAVDPGTMAERLRPGFAAWVGSVDFGELKTTVDAMAENTAALAGMANEEIWRYPTKMVCLLSLLPSAVSAGIVALARSVEPINRLAPDLLADVLMSLLREVRGAEVGRLVNEVCELIRKVHTGSVLIGEHGKPRMPAELSAFVGDVLRTIDGDLVLKARMLLADTAEVTEQAILELLDEHPELVREMVAAGIRRKAAALRRLARRTDLVERTLSGDEIGRVLAAGLREIDAQQLAETLSRLLAIANRMREQSPDVFRDVLVQAMASLDEGEVRQATEGLVEDVVAAVKPLAGEILPPVLRGIAQLIRADADDAGGDVQAALGTLRAALAGKEGAA